MAKGGPYMAHIIYGTGMGRLDDGIFCRLTYKMSFSKIFNAHLTNLA